MNYEELLEVLYEDNHVVGVNKPSGWPSAHFEGENDTVDRLVKAYLKEKYRKPGNVFLGVVHRLDKPVSGCLLFARTSKAASRLSEQFRAGGVEKVYWAVIESSRTTPWLEKADSGVFEDWLMHDDDSKKVRVAATGEEGAKAARTIWQVLSRKAGMALLELRPHTGRKHQLRVQLSARGAPIYGDRKYGSKHLLGHAIALHAHSITFLHPVRSEPITLKAELPRHWRGRFAELLRDEG